MLKERNEKQKINDLIDSLNKETSCQKDADLYETDFLQLGNKLIVTVNLKDHSGNVVETLPFFLILIGY